MYKITEFLVAHCPNWDELQNGKFFLIHRFFFSLTVSMTDTKRESSFYVISLLTT